MLGDIQLK